MTVEATKFLFAQNSTHSLPLLTATNLQTMCFESPNAELCGFIVDDSRIIPVPNAAADPRTTFRIASADSIAMHREFGPRITGLFHTHPSGRPNMSHTDVTDAEELYRAGCPWRYYVVTSTTVTEYEWIG